MNNGEYRVNLDRGNQSTGGKDALVLGTIANTNTDCATPVYESKTLTNSTPIDVVSDANGVLWLFFGIDSGYESASHIYYQSITINATPF